MHRELISGEQRLPSVRGLVLLRNARGRPFASVDVLRWIRLNCLGFQAQKIDLFLRGEAPVDLESLFEQGARFGARLSIRTTCDQSPPDLASLKLRGLLDVFLTPREATAAKVNEWLDAAREASVPVRLQVQAPFEFEKDAAEELAKQWHDSGVVAVNIALADPFLEKPACRDKSHSESTVAIANRLAEAVASREIEVNLLFWPESVIEPGNRVHLVTARRFSNDHQQYEAEAFALAARLNKRGPTIARLVLLMLLNQYTSYRNPIDSALFPWIINRPWLHARAWALHKITRYWRKRNRSRREVEREKLATAKHEPWISRVDNEIQESTPKPRVPRGLPPPAGDKRSEPSIVGTDPSRPPEADSLGSVPVFLRVFRVLTGLEAEPESGTSRYPSREQPKYYDEIDRDRLHFDETLTSLAEEARDIVNNRPPTRELDSFDYEVEGQAMMQMPGGNRWFSFTNTEKLSTPLGRFEAPFTIAVTIGGGSADYIGFGLGRRRKVLCPMEAYVHRLVLHVAPDGRYVLLRDDVPMRPEVLERGMYTPARLGGVL
ncbi:MAG: hypothetical protein U9Q79_08715, partial [Candidatus Hydrogenedentes bacterium]|nr:hypothetical protein [Candidatus Hydrogenedentota bacterium]